MQLLLSIWEFNLDMPNAIHVQEKVTLAFKGLFLMKKEAKKGTSHLMNLVDGKPISDDETINVQYFYLVGENKYMIRVSDHFLRKKDSVFPIPMIEVE